MQLKHYNWKLYKVFAVLTVVLLASLSIFYFYNSRKVTSDACQNIEDSGEKTACWKKIIDKSLESQDLNQTMDLIANLYNDNSDFASNCHDFMHLTGKNAYDLFAQGKKFKVGDKTSYCAYGFYHGFMESLISKNGDISTARDFCTFIDGELSKTAPGAKLACYHGIGHGWTNVHDPNFSGSELTLIYPALALCEKITQDSEELKICATGVFDSISIGYYNQLSGFKMDKKKPYWVCEQQEEKYKIPCYMDISPAVLWLGEYRLDKTLAYINTVEAKYLDLVINTIAEDSARFIIEDSLNVEDQVKICRSLGSNKSIACLNGLAAGFLQFGAPGREEESVFGFCQSSFLTSEEKDSCYSTALNNVKNMYSLDRYNDICSNTNREYTRYCEK